MILATHTSSISITRIAACTERAERVIGMHFMNPVPVMKLVEIIRGLRTSDETCREVTALAERLGKTPVECRDFPGFVTNRVLMPMINEAVFCLHEGVADAASIDGIMKLGMNHPMGPLALADLIGLDTCLYILEVLHDGLGEDKYRPCPLPPEARRGRVARPQGRPRLLRLLPKGVSERIEVALAVAMRSGRVLVARRGEGAHLEGLWEFPGGKIESGETPPAAAARELREETALEEPHQ